MSQRDKKKVAGQMRAIAEHEKKKATYPDPRDKAFADKTIRNAQGHLDRLRGKKK